MISPTQGDIDRALCGFDPRDEIHIRSGVTAMGTSFTRGYIADQATAAKHREALEKIAAAGPAEEPEPGVRHCNMLAAEGYGTELGYYEAAEIARAALKDEDAPAGKDTP
jgi:hypothetical protein